MKFLPYCLHSDSLFGQHLQREAMEEGVNPDKYEVKGGID